MNNQHHKQKFQPRKNKAAESLDINAMVYKTAPQAVDLEMAVLGSVLTEPDALFTISDFLSEQCFYREAHQALFRIFTGMHSDRKHIDAATVLEELRKSGELDMIGGPYYLSQLVSSVTNTARNAEYCRIILQKFMRRELIKNAGEILAAAYDETYDEFEMLEDAEQRIFGISQHHSPEEMKPMDSVIMDTTKHIESNRLLKNTNGGITGVPTPFKQISIATRGWQPSDMIILAARPSVGKTAAALKIVRTAASNCIKSVPVALFSLEMQATRLALRMVSAEGNILLHKLQSGNVENDEMQQLYRGALTHLAKQKIFIDDRPGLTPAKLRSKCRRMKSKHDIGLIVIDYLQLMSHGTGKNMNREQEIAYISRSLKTLAMELQVPVIALSQMSREIEKRTSKTPQLSDLRESGSIEQDADMVMFLYGATDEEIKLDSSLLTRRYIKIAKQRDGMLITTEVMFQNPTQEWEELEQPSPGTTKPALPAGNLKPVPNYRDPSTSQSKEDEEENPF